MSRWLKTWREGDLVGLTDCLSVSKSMISKPEPITLAASEEDVAKIIPRQLEMWREGGFAG